MAEIDAVFKRRRIKSERLLPFGFTRRKNAYTYSTPLMGGQFAMTVAVARDGKVSAEVRDAISKEPYVLHRVAGAKGAFAGAVREEYEAVLAAIAAACFEPDVFKSDGARRVIRHIGKKYGDEPEFLWERFPDNAIFRRRDNEKWYAALLTVKKGKLGLDGDDSIEIIDLRGRPEQIPALVDGKKYFPGYHMNKKHWFTMCFDRSVPAREMYARIDESYALAAR